MSHIAIRADRVGKSYILGHNIAAADGNNSLREALTNGVRNFARKTRDTFAGRPVVQGDKVEEFWALKDVSFEIRQGDRVGLIGRNGAGKSTLLKLLSRISEPTTGSISIMGRVASLLEVGTGFHPELTGRENVFLNGAILGMSKAEIAMKFDEIVDFAGVERFLDTPVKRYSSGMYVRLAFAVAAHLEPEILIVDEVLAVGDAQFQKKCMGKMESVGREGRTVIFVSHSMPSITSLCDRAILLESGRVILDGTPSAAILKYYKSNNDTPDSVNFSASHVGDHLVRLLSASVANHTGKPMFEIALADSFKVSMDYEVLETSVLPLAPNFHFMTASGDCVFVSVAESARVLPPGTYTATCEVPGYLLNEGAYFVGLAMSSFEDGVNVHFYEKNALSFNVADPMAADATRGGWAGAMPGVVRPKLKWTVTPASN